MLLLTSYDDLMVLCFLESCCLILASLALLKIIIVEKISCIALGVPSPTAHHVEYGTGH